MSISTITEKVMTSQKSMFSSFLVISPILPLIISVMRMIRNPIIQRQSGLTKIAVKIIENKPLAPA